MAFGNRLAGQPTTIGFVPVGCPLPLLGARIDPELSRRRTQPVRGLNKVVVRAAWRDWERATRPGHDDEANEAANRLRFDSLPAGVQTPNQMLGRLSSGCEGTHGVFPKCNFGCTPCYHSEDANKVRIDGQHTRETVQQQMDLMRKARGDHGYCQLIGGEVSLLPAEDHAATLSIMHEAGRLPMSFTHGDFEYEYLRKVAVNPETGRPRFPRLDFAVHFDSFMYGRTGIRQPKSEAELDPYRSSFVEMFRKLRRDHGVDYYLAHNMTIQPGNVGQIPAVIRQAKQQGMGWRMMSFQPAAFQGDSRRWSDDYSRIAKNDGEEVWRMIEEGAGCRLPYKVFQMGDQRCNRTCYGALVGPDRSSKEAQFVPFFDDQEPADLQIRDFMMQHVGNIALPPPQLWVKAVRVAIKHPGSLVTVFKWARSFAKRAGGLFHLFRHGWQPLAFVMHRFMDADDITAAWTLMEKGKTPSSPDALAAAERVPETMERLAACAYGMAQVGQNRVVPACVQHAVYDPQENIALRTILPLYGPRADKASLRAK